MAPSTSTLRVMLLVGLIVGTSLFGFSMMFSGGGTSPRPRGLLLVDGVAEEQAVRRTMTYPPRVDGRDTAACFKNKVMWQPTTCSQLHELISAVAGPSALWTFAFLGVGAGAAYKVAEINDALGDSQHGAKALGAAMLKEYGSGSQFCGACCECVSSNVSANSHATTVRHAVHSQLFIIDAKQPSASIVKALGPSADLRAIKSTRDDNCSAILQAMAASLTDNPPSVVSLESGVCDAKIVRELVLPSGGLRPALRPLLLQLSMHNASEDYGELISRLAIDAGYMCYFHTMRPAHKTFRGVRVPPYPVVVAASGSCWRSVFSNFKGDRQLLTCHAKTNNLLASLMARRSRQVHKGLQNGCMPKAGRVKAFALSGGVAKDDTW